MHSPFRQNHLPFASLQTSQAPQTIHLHSRTHSGAKSITSAPQTPHELTRAPSSKKLTLTYQPPHIQLQKGGEVEGRRRGIGEGQGKGYISLQTSTIRQSGQEEEESCISQQSVMVYFQQKVENLKQQYLQALRDYQSKIDCLQAQLYRNSQLLESKQAEINRLQSSVKELRKQDKNNRQEPHLQLRIQDLEKRMTVLGSHAESSVLQTREIADRLTQKVVKCFGSRLSILRAQQLEFMRLAAGKLVNLEGRVQFREKKEQSVGTRGSMESVEEAPLEDQGVSFWDDCFFYPGEHSENCNLIAEMSTRRNEPLKCWVDHLGLLRYCDSGSFVFNRRGEKVGVSESELEWLIAHSMVRIY